MNAEICLQKLKLIKVLAFATVDMNNNPQIRNISAIHYEKNALYFFTARGKNFSRELQNNSRVQILGYSKFKEMIRLSGRAVPVEAEKQQYYMNLIFEEQPYLRNVYPDDTKNIGIIYCIKDMQIEYFNLGVRPIFREVYTVGNIEFKPKGYFISDSCIGCGICLSVCPQHCIQKGEIYKIQPQHCLHCGACYERCPVKAVKRWGE